MQSHDYSVTFSNGPLGFVLRRIHGFAVVSRLVCQPSGEAGQAADSGVTVGSILVEVIGQTSDSSFGNILRALSASTRPVRLRFQRLQHLLRPVPTPFPVPAWRGPLTVATESSSEWTTLLSGIAQIHLGGANRRQQEAAPSTPPQFVAVWEHCPEVSLSLSSDVVSTRSGGRHQLLVCGTWASSSDPEQGVPSDVRELFQRRLGRGPEGVSSASRPWVMDVELASDVRDARMDLHKVLAMRAFPFDLEQQAYGSAGPRVVLQGMLYKWDALVARFSMGGRWNLYFVTLRTDGSLQWYLPDDERRGKMSTTAMTSTTVPVVGRGAVSGSLRPRGGCSISTARLVLHPDVLCRETGLRSGSFQEHASWALDLGDTTICLQAGDQEDRDLWVEAIRRDIRSLQTNDSGPLVDLAQPIVSMETENNNDGSTPLPSSLAPPGPPAVSIPARRHEQGSTTATPMAAIANSAREAVYSAKGSVRRGLHDPAILLAIRWSVLRQLRALRDRPSLLFSQPERAFSLLVRAARDMDDCAASLRWQAGHPMVPRSGSIALPPGVEWGIGLARPGSKRARKARAWWRDAHRQQQEQQEQQQAQRTHTGSGADEPNVATPPAEENRSGSRDWIQQLYSRVAEAFSKKPLPPDIGITDWTVISDSDEIADRYLVEHGDAYWKRSIRDDGNAFLRRHHFVLLAPRFLPLLADAYTAGIVFDALVEDGERLWVSSHLEVGVLPRAEQAQNEMQSPSIFSDSSDDSDNSDDSDEGLMSDVEEDEEDDDDDDPGIDGDEKGSLGADEGKVSFEDAVGVDESPGDSASSEGDAVQEARQRYQREAKSSRMKRARRKLRRRVRGQPQRSERNFQSRLGRRWYKSERTRSYATPGVHVDVRRQNESVLTLDLFKNYVRALGRSATHVHSNWDTLRDALELDTRETLIRTEEYMQMIFTVEARPPLYTLAGPSSVTEDAFERIRSWRAIAPGQEMSHAPPVLVSPRSPPAAILSWPHAVRLFQSARQRDKVFIASPASPAGWSPIGMLPVPAAEDRSVSSRPLQVASAISSTMGALSGGTTSNAVTKSFLEQLYCNLERWRRRTLREKVRARHRRRRHAWRREGLTLVSNERGYGIISDSEANSGVEDTIGMESSSDSSDADATETTPQKLPPSGAVSKEPGHGEPGESMTRGDSTGGRPSDASSFAGGGPVVQEETLEGDRPRHRRHSSRRSHRHRSHGGSQSGSNIGDGDEMDQLATLEHLGLPGLRAADAMAPGGGDAKKGPSAASAGAGSKGSFWKWTTGWLRKRKRPVDPSDPLADLEAATGGGGSGVLGDERSSGTSRPQQRASRRKKSRGGENNDLAGEGRVERARRPSVEEEEEDEAAEEDEEALETSLGSQLRSEGRATVRLKGTLFLTDERAYFQAGKETLVFGWDGVQTVENCATRSSRMGLSRSRDDGLHIATTDIRLVTPEMKDYSEEDDDGSGSSQLRLLFAAAEGITNPSRDPSEALLPPLPVRALPGDLLDPRRVRNNARKRHHTSDRFALRTASSDALGVSSARLQASSSATEVLPLRTVSTSSTSSPRSDSGPVRPGTPPGTEGSNLRLRRIPSTQSTTTTFSGRMAGRAAVNGRAGQPARPALTRQVGMSELHGLPSSPASAPGAPAGEARQQQQHQHGQGDDGVCQGAVLERVRLRRVLRGSCRTHVTLVFSRMKDFFLSRGEEREGGRRRVVRQIIEDVVAASRQAARLQSHPSLGMGPVTLPMALRSLSSSVAKSVLARSERDDVTLSRRLQRWSALNLLRTRALLKATGRCEDRLLLCTLSQEISTEGATPRRDAASDVLETLQPRVQRALSSFPRGNQPELVGRAGANPLAALLFSPHGQFTDSGQQQQHATGRAGGRFGAGPAGWGRNAHPVLVPGTAACAVAQAATQAQGQALMDEGGSRARRSLAAVATVAAEPDPTWIVHAAAFSARDEEAWRRRHAATHTLEVARLQQEWATFSTLVLYPLSRMWLLHKYVLAWQDPILSVMVLFLLLLCPWYNLFPYWMPLFLLTLVAAIMGYGAIDQSHRTLLTRLVQGPAKAKRKSMFEKLFAFRTSMGTAQYRLHKLNTVLLKMQSLMMWRDPTRTSIFLVLLGVSALFFTLVPARWWFTAAVLQQFSKPLRRSPGPGLTMLALSRFIDGLPVPSTATSLREEILGTSPRRNGLEVRALTHAGTDGLVVQPDAATPVR